MSSGMERMILIIKHHMKTIYTAIFQSFSLQKNLQLDRYIILFENFCQTYIRLYTIFFWHVFLFQYEMLSVQNLDIWLLISNIFTYKIEDYVF
jgi:hypothetical protein